MRLKNARLMLAPKTGELIPIEQQGYSKPSLWLAVYEPPKA